MKYVKSFLFTFLLLSIITSAYLFTIKGSWGNPTGGQFKNNLDQATRAFELSPERDRYVLIMSLINDHRFNLSKVLADAAYPDTGYYQGRYYIYFTPGISLLAIPLYLIGQHYHLAQVASFSLNILFSLGVAFFIYKIATKILSLPPFAGVLAALIYMFASDSWSYAVTLYQHQATTFLLMSAFFAAWWFNQSKRFSWLAAIYVWLSFAISLLIDYPNGFFFLPIMMYFCLSNLRLSYIDSKLQITIRWSIFLTSIIFIIISIGHGYYNQVNFGSWHSLSSTLVGVKTIEQRNLLNSSDVQQTLQSLADKKTVTSFFSENKFPFGFYTLFFSLDRGLFLYFPIFILAVFGLSSFIKYRNAGVATLLAISLCVVFLYSSWGDPWGGWAFGPRYLIPALPIFSLLVVTWLSQKKWQLGRKLLATPLLMYSVAVALIGVLTTNAVPPKVEADYLHTGYNFLLNWQYLKNNYSSSFVFNTFINHKLPLWEYALAIYLFIIVTALLVLFVMPHFSKHDN